MKHPGQWVTIRVCTFLGNSGNRTTKVIIPKGVYLTQIPGSYLRGQDAIDWSYRVKADKKAGSRRSIAVNWDGQIRYLVPGVDVKRRDDYGR